jgi:hypothetical protein
MVPDVQSAVEQALELLRRPFWQHTDFWIATILGIAGVIFSLLAFVEARKAKRAAVSAGRTVKVQTVAIELTEITQKLDRIQPGIRYSEARDLLAEISRRLHRATSPFTEDPKLSGAISPTLEGLQAAQNSLKAVRPTDPAKENEAPRAVYNAIEDSFATINNSVADLLGLLEKETFDFGDEDGNS